MLGLLIETSTEKGMAAILKEDRLIFHIELPFGYQNSQFLLPQIEKGLEELKLSVKDFHFIAAGIGPGSYTGIRVGVTVAKSLSYPFKIPLVGISTLKTFVPEGEGHFAVLIDAKIGGVYMIKGHKKDGGIIYTSDPEIVPTPLLEEKLRGVEILVAPYLELLQSKFSNRKATWQMKNPDPIHMGLLAQAKVNCQEYSTEGDLQIKYLRNSFHIDKYV